MRPAQALASQLSTIATSHPSTPLFEACTAAAEQVGAYPYGDIDACKRAVDAALDAIDGALHIPQRERTALWLSVDDSYRRCHNLYYRHTKANLIPSPANGWLK